MLEVAVEALQRLHRADAGARAKRLDAARVGAAPHGPAGALGLHRGWVDARRKAVELASVVDAHRVVVEIERSVRPTLAAELQFAALGRRLNPRALGSAGDPKRPRRRHVNRVDFLVAVG